MYKYDNNFLNENRDRRKINVNVDTDSDEEEHALEWAVMQYKKNKKKGNYDQSTDNPKFDKDEINQNQSAKLASSTENNGAKETLNESGSVTSNVQDLIKYFMVSKKSLKKNQQETAIKTLRDYESQGAIPKQKVNNTSNKSKKITAKVSDRDKSFASQKNHNKDYHRVRVPEECLSSLSKGKKLNIPKNVKTDGNVDLNWPNPDEKTFSRPFFYIVPEKPSPNFSFPRGSYYVIPKVPDGSIKATIIFHPECLTSELNPNMNAREINPRITKKRLKNMNNLGKDVHQPVDSHLNIGPVQAREDCAVNNLEVNYGPIKLFEKSLISPKKPPEVINIAQKKEEMSKDASEENDEEVYYSNLDGAVTERAHQLLGLSNEESNSDTSLYEQESLQHLSIEYLDQIIMEQYERMIEHLPESNVSDLLKKCIEFQGNKEKVTAYIEKTLRKARWQQLITDVQYILPDVDPSFLLEKIKEVNDDDNAINILTCELLESQNYPRISRNIFLAKEKLWLTYVKNFDVKSYLLKVPKPEDFAGKSGDQNKADEKLIIAFLQSRYPTVSAQYLKSKFYSNSRNITKTCDSLAEFQVVRLSEGTFEYENFDEDFLKEICYIDHKEEIDNHLKTVKEIKEIETLEGAFLVCPLCSDEELIASEVVTCPEGDVFCKECIRRYVETKIGDATYRFACPTQDCDAFFTLPILEDILPATVISLVTEKQQAEEVRVADVDDLEFCPRCDFAYIPNPNDKIFRCQNLNCLTETCRSCREENHIPLRCEEIERDIDAEARKKIEETMTGKLIRNCPNCSKKYVKIDGCNLIACVCGTKVCYICSAIIAGYDHFKYGPCPLHSNNEELHTRMVLQAGISVKNEILSQNPNIRIPHDPTKSFRDE